MNKRPIKRMAIITEFLCNFGGIEKCILVLARELAARGIDFDIYAGLYYPEKTFPEFKSMRIKRLLKKKLPAAINALAMRKKFRNLRLRGYDGYVIYGFHSIAAARQNHPNVWWSTNALNYLYGLEGKGPDKSGEYLYGKNNLKKILVRLYLKYLRYVDQKDFKFIDKTLAVGVLAKKRLENAYPIKDIPLVFAPVNLEKFKHQKQRGYYLSVARLSDEKNVDKIVRAFRNMPEKRLYVVGTGPSERKIKELANGCRNITFFGFKDDKGLGDLVGRSIAMIGACENEDYSMNLIESIACGKPTISVNTDRSKKGMELTPTGVLIEAARPEFIEEAVKFLTPNQAQKMKKACIKKSKLFSKENYINGIMNSFD